MWGYFLLHFDFSVNTSWEGEILEALDRLWGGIEDIDEAFVDLHFEGFTTGLVDVWALYHGKGGALGWKRHWATYLSTGTDSGVNDLLGALIN